MKNNVPFRPKEIWEDAQFGEKDQNKKKSYPLVVGRISSIMVFYYLSYKYPKYKNAPKL